MGSIWKSAVAFLNTIAKNDFNHYIIPVVLESAENKIKRIGEGGTGPFKQERVCVGEGGVMRY